MITLRRIKKKKKNPKKHAYLTSKFSNFTHTNLDIYDSYIANMAITGSSEPSTLNSYHNALLTVNYYHASMFMIGTLIVVLLIT